MTAPEPSRRRVVHVMGTAVSLAARGRHAEGPLADEAWEAAVGVLRDADAVFSTYRPDSPVSRWRRGELALAECPPQVAEVLELAERARVESHGAFDVRYGGAAGLPDPTGVVKGWAVQRAADLLGRLPGTDFCLSAGGDLVCRTVQPDAPPWQVGIEDPRAPQRLLATVPVHNGAVATSGTAHRGQHIVDPMTGRPPTALLQVTVLATDLTWADIEATAAFVLGDWGDAWLATRNRTGILVRTDGTAQVVSPQASSGTASSAQPSSPGPSSRESSRRATSWLPASPSRPSAAAAEWRS